ncbi:male sterility protein [Colletotrichum filicis]|nr:male sterility protein [Colletotrichum filicis]
MAPIAMSDLNSPSSIAAVDPTVFPALDADEKLKKLWQLHGHPHSSRFSDPKLTSVAALVEHNAVTQPSKPAFIHPIGDSFEVLDWARLNQFYLRASSLYSKQFREEIGAANETGQQPTVALLGVGNSISYLITQFALNRLHLRVLLLSNKNSLATRDHLLRVCNVIAIIIDEANEASLHGESPGQLPLTKLISLDELRENKPEAFEEPCIGFETDDDLGYPPDCLHCAPSVIEDLYEYITLTTKDYTPLTDLKVLQPGGAPLSPSMLSKLQNIGVNIKTTYGTTETGPPLRTIPHTRDNPNVYRFRNLYPDSEHVGMESIADNLFECVVYRGFPLAAELWLEETAPNPYRTGDLFIEDPPGSGYFVLQGRRDDILVHSNGEKTHAAALAMALEEDKTSTIAKTAVFGTGKPCPSVVVEIDWSC